jgi:hypothetical protein
LVRPWRNRVEHLPGKIMGAAGEIIERKDANYRLLTVQNRQWAHAFIPHEASCLLAVLVLETARNESRHDFPRRRPRRVLAGPNDTAADIAVCYQTNRLSILPHRKYADAQLVHLSRAFARRRSRSDPLYFR